MQKVKAILNDQSVSGTIIVTTGLFVSSIFSYFLQFALGRFLSVQEYGDFNALLSLFYIVGVPSTVLGISIIKVVSELKAENEYEKVSGLFWHLSLFSLIFGLLYRFENPFVSFLQMGLERMAGQQQVMKVLFLRMLPLR